LVRAPRCDGPQRRDVTAQGLITALFLVPLAAAAGVEYDVNIRPVDQSNLSIAARDPLATVIKTPVFVQDGKVRMGGPAAKRIYLFKGRTMTVIDVAAATAHVLEHATLSQVSAHYAEALRHLDEVAASAAPQDRAEAEQKARDAKAANDRLMQDFTRDYRVTARVESVDGRPCRIWEEWEHEAKRLELCVAKPAAVPGGAEILEGLKTMSQFREGSSFAFGIDFGLAEWWADIARLGGVPLLIREFKFDALTLEVSLADVRVGTLDAGLMDIPSGYQVQQGPDYARWYVR
jgi:hypothetical protein